MQDLEHARMMLTLARKDLKAMRGMTDVEDFDVEIFGFHAQQAVEKILKAWLSLAGVEYPRTHNLMQLFTLIEECGRSILVGLTQFKNRTIENKGFTQNTISRKSLKMALSA